jgi:hypothetical protein
MRIFGMIKGATLGALIALALGAGLYLSSWREDLYRSTSAEVALARATVDQQQEDMAAMEAKIVFATASDSLKNQLAAAQSEYHAGREKLEKLWNSGEKISLDGFFAWLGALGSYAIPAALLLIAAGGLGGSITGRAKLPIADPSPRRVIRPQPLVDSELPGLEATPRARRAVTTKFPQLSKGQSALLNAIRKAGRAAAEAESDLDDVIEKEVGAGLEAGFDVGGPRKFEKKNGAKLGFKPRRRSASSTRCEKSFGSQNQGIGRTQINFTL